MGFKLLSSLLLPALVRAATTFTSTGNPILADGSYYSADPAPLVVNNTLYIWAGRDEAPVGTNNFIMNEWQVFATTSANPADGTWTHYPNVTRPRTVFAWAATGTAYAAQVVQGANGKFYLYAPVTQSSTSASDKFAIGVAVADSPTGPYTDAHPSGPIVSQLVPSPGNSIQNIDPSVFVDTDGKVYLYEGEPYILIVARLAFSLFCRNLRTASRIPTCERHGHNYLCCHDHHWSYGIL